MAGKALKPKSRTTNITELADFAGVSRNTIYNWQRLAGYPAAADGSVCLWDLAVWRTRLEIGDAVDDPELVGSSDSPNLERMRKVRADIWELELETKRGNFMPVEEIRAALGELSSIIRGVGEKLQRQIGPDAADILGEGLTEFERRMAERFQDEPERGVDGDGDPGAGGSAQVQ